jgi:glycosyltransferase involved in cell wall biosynthesis
VGHIRSTRNIESLLKIQKINNIQVVVVGSSSTPTEEDLKNRLMKYGVRVIDEYIPDISKIYKLSDIYVFPVLNKIASIYLPLSILEAMSCNLPVLTTRFGGLPDNFKEDIGFKFFDTTEELVELIKEYNFSKVENRHKIEKFTWSRFADEVLTACDELL